MADPLDIESLNGWADDAVFTNVGGTGVFRFPSVIVPFDCTDRSTNIPVTDDLYTNTIGLDFFCERIIAFLSKPCASGVFTLDIMKNNVSVFSTPLRVDAGEQTNVTAAIQAVLSINSWNEGDIMRVRVTNYGDGTAQGLGLQFVGYRRNGSIADTVPPTNPSGLSAFSGGPDNIDLSWTPGTDNIGVAGYNIQRATNSGFTTGVTNLTTSGIGTTFNDDDNGAGLAQSTQYFYRVKTRDIQGNLSTSWSNVANATTDAGLDTDAQAFITATGISDNGIKNAINDLVLAFKAAGIWTKKKAIYPFVGGTAGAHKFNLKNPLDTDAAFRLTFVGASLVHNSNGMTCDAVNGSYADTHVNPDTHLTNNNTFMSFYSGTNSNLNIEMGVSVSSNQFYLGSRSTLAGDALIATAYSATDRIIVANATGAGFYAQSRTSSTSLKAYKNGTQLGSTYTTAETSALPSANIWIGGQNDGGSLNQPSDKSLRYVSIGDGLSDSEVTDEYNAVLAFETALGRN